MTITTAMILGVGMGALFGLALEKSRVFEPGAIISQMQLRTFLMMKIFLTAVVTGLLVLAALNGLFGVKMHPKALVWPADIVGGVLLGAGISLAGACPGTVFAQMGVGYRDAIVTFVGGVLGALVFGYLEPTLKPLLLSGGPGKLTYDTVSHIPFWLVAVGVAIALVACLVVLEHVRPWRDEQGENFDGLAKPRDAAASFSNPGMPAATR